MNSDFISEMIPYFGQKEQKDEFKLFDTQKAKALALQQKINDTDNEIDRMGYELYGLTEEEIKIVEGVSEQ